MSSTVEITDVDTLRADLAGLEQQQRALLAEQKSPALRTNSARRQAIGHELNDLAVLIADAKIAVLEGQIAELSAQHGPLYEAKAQAHEDSQRLFHIEVPAAKLAFEDAQRRLHQAQGAYIHAENSLNSLSQQEQELRRQIAAIR